MINLKKLVLLALFVLTPSLSANAQLPVKIADNLEPVMLHSEQQKEAEKKLETLQKKFGKRPNILIFLVDDMGWGDPGVYGGGHAIGAPTPNIDGLARDGLMLTSTYSQPSCSPTRATLMTGRLPPRHGIVFPPSVYQGGLTADEITAAKILSESGYVTQLVGKWHLGEKTENQPQNLGYDDFYGFLGVCQQYTAWRDAHLNPEFVYNPERTEIFKKPPFNNSLVHAEKGKEIEKIKEITIPVLAELDQDFADYSVRFIRNMAKSDKPFFLIHSFSKVHSENYPAKGYKGKSPSKYPYKDAILEVDDIVGRIIKTLKETGQTENTFVFFTSDNGPNEDIWPDAGWDPFRGAKGSTWEGGVRVPGIAWWPGMIEKGRISDGLFDLSDLFNTSLVLAGVKDKIPSDRYIDGIDQTSFLLAENGESNRHAVYYWLKNTFAAVRIGEHKYHTHIAVVGTGAVDSMGCLGNATIQKATTGMLYNLYIDPGERKPLVAMKGLCMTPYISQALYGHLGSFKKYPPKVKIEF